MTHKRRQPTPVNIISGFLGSGKTTAINYLLKQKPADERWAVIVNEYGKVGIDQAMFSSTENEPSIEVKQLAGGCICCSASFLLHGYMLILLQRYKPDRLIIEPTGLATLMGILETLSKPGVKEAVELKTIVTLVDPALWVQQRMHEQEAWKDQVEHANVLLANRCDLSSEEILNQFKEEIEPYKQSKHAIQFVEHAQFDISLLDSVTNQLSNTPAEQSHGFHNNSPEAKQHTHSTYTYT